MRESPNWVRRQDEGDAQATSKPARGTELLELRGQVVTMRTATGGLDKGCVRCPESDINGFVVLARVPGISTGTATRLAEAAPRVRRGAGVALVLRGREYPGPWTIVAPRRQPPPYRATPRWLSGTERGVFRVARAQGGGGAAARRVWCRRQKTPARVIDRRRRRRGLGAPLVQATTLRRVRSGNKGARPAPWPLGWWPSGHGGEQDGHRTTGWRTPVLVSRGRPGVPRAAGRVRSGAPPVIPRCSRSVGGVATRVAAGRGPRPA